MTRRLFVDLDGVLADFDGEFPRLFGQDHREIGDNEMWRLINEHGSYFMDLPPCEGALEFFADYENEIDGILTACPKSNYDDVALQKKAWVREHLGVNVLVLPSAGGMAKPMFLQNTGDILIDDFPKNCRAWRKAGGVAILHTGDWQATRNRLGELGLWA